MVKKPETKIRKLGILVDTAFSPAPQGRGVSIRLWFSSGEAVEFLLPAKGAVSVMRVLSAYQKKYHWPIPLTKIPV
jgi:hypothetical protein